MQRDGHYLSPDENFRSVVVAGSITKASHRIGLSQPSISQQLARLETTLNTQLILRNRSGLVSMTPAGEYWYKISGEMLERMEVVMAEHDQSFRASNVVLRLGAVADKIHPVLRHYVEIDPSVPTRAASDDWYRTHFPHARASFRAPTFAASAEFAAGGLATCHLLVSLLPNLSRTSLANLKLFGNDGMKRTVILAMRQHLLSHGAYARIFHRITEFCQTEYAPEMGQENLRSLAEMQEAAPGWQGDVLLPRSLRPRTRA